MPDYDAQPHVVATVHVKVGSVNKAFGPGEAAAVKDAAAHWLRAVCDNVKPKVRITAKVDQHSPDVTDEDGAPYWWRGNAADGREYAAQFLERFPAWGGSRAAKWGGSREG